MISKIKSSFAPSTAKALKGFNKAVSQLRAVSALENAEADKQYARMIRARDARNAAIDRAKEADRTADKLAEFVA